MITVIVSGIVTGFLYAIAGLGLVAVYRTSRVLNFALGGMGGMSVYFATELLSRHVPYGVVIVASLVVAALIGLIVEAGVARPLRRRPTLTIAIATLAALLIFQGVLEARYGYSARGMPEILRGSGTLRIGSFALSANQLLIIVLGVVATAFLLFLTYRTRFGLTMRAASSGPQTCELLGVDLAATTRVAWMIGGAYGALAALMVTPLTYLTPSSFTMFLLTAFAAVVLGGFTSIAGVVVGALVFGVCTNLLEVYLN
ncbi:MAG: branched-chain amino acid ABC transporter permease, partial [Acidimicrobiales bacterium]